MLWRGRGWREEGVRKDVEKVSNSSELEARRLAREALTKG